MTPLNQIVDEVNRRANGRSIGGLQDLRKVIRGLHHKAQKVFGRVRKDEYSYHIGGWDELQFNLGIEKPFDDIDAADFRFGVAFSLETSPSLRSIDSLIPKVARFNDYLRANPEDFADLWMWHHADGKRSAIARPAPIEQGLVRPRVFVLLGVLGHSAAPDYGAVLDTLDRLLPLYRFVESGDGQVIASANPWTEPPLRLRPPAPTGWTTATTTARTLDVALRHRALQTRLCEELVALYGASCVGEEHPTRDGGRVDVIVRTATERILFEIKTASTARGCIREALGQALDYACWPGSPTIERIVIVGAAQITSAEAAYIDQLNQSFPVPVAYRRVALEGE